MRLLGIIVVLAALVSGCTSETEVAGVSLPNSRPDTHITGYPTPLEASFVIELKWTGTDEDGSIAGYEWKVSDNGNDGISPRDTLTVDPLTGAVLNPWHFTVDNDTILVLLADQSGFPGDGPINPRSYRTHSVFIRAVDDQGAVDPSPAYISFTSTTIVPDCRVVYPNLTTQSSKRVPSTVNLGWEGKDPDFEDGTPTHMRFLWKSAQYDTTALGDPLYIRTPFEFNLHYAEVLNFDDPEWSLWSPYDPVETNRRLRLSNLPNGEHFLFAVQVRDTAGAVSIGMGYQKEVANVRVAAGAFAPSVELTERILGTTIFSEKFDRIASNQPLNFSWVASADTYNGDIESYRHGWDLLDIDDPNDPGWAVPPGTTKQNLYAKERTYLNGFHTFSLRIEDDSGQLRIVNWGLEIIASGETSGP